MARPPSMTREEAERAALAAVGPRGSLVTSENRSHIQAWLCATGIPSITAKAARLATLNKAWASDRYVDAMLDGIKRRNGGQIPDTSPEADAAALEADTAAAVDTPLPQASPAPRDVASRDVASEALEALKRALGDTGAGKLDEERVRKIAAEIAFDIAEDRGAKNAEAVMAMVEKRLEALAPKTITHNVTVTDPTGNVTTIKRAHPMLSHILKALAAGVHVFAAGPAGCGKTHLAEQAAEALGADYYSTGAVDSPYALLGFKSAHGEYQRTPFRDAFERGGVFLFDEIDASDAAALLVVNQALANGRMAFPDGMVARHEKFRVIACANTYGHGADRLYVGRSQLDAATLDRFARVGLDYDESLERELADHDVWVTRVQAIRKEARSMSARVVVSMRASINGANLIAAGWHMTDVEDALIFAGHDKPTVERLRAAADRAEAALLAGKKRVA